VFLPLSLFGVKPNPSILILVPPIDGPDFGV
jgi:hypothetical protein